MYTGTGTIVYDPYRAGMKKRTAWWCIVDVDREITRYYRWWVDKLFLNPLAFEGEGLKRPSWDAHISVIRGEKPFADKLELWKKYDGHKVEFKYPAISDFKIGHASAVGDAPGKFFIIDIECPHLISIRKEFGFKSDWKLHITFGRTYDRKEV